MRIGFAFALIFAFYPYDLTATTQKDAPYVSCRDDAKKYEMRSGELQQISAADQADRPDNKLKPGTLFRDRQRRERVGSIFGEGCFKEAKDFPACAFLLTGRIAR